MEITVVNREAYTINNPKLVKATEAITKLANSIMSNYAKIGKILSQVKTDKLYLEDFKTFADWVETAFNMSLNTANRIIRVTETLMIPDSEANHFSGFADTALAALTSVGDYDDVVKFCNEHDIDETTSVRDIVKIVRASKTNGDEQADEGDGETVEENVPRDFIAEAMEDFRKYLVSLRSQQPTEFARITGLFEKKVPVIYDVVEA